MKRFVFEHSKKVKTYFLMSWAGLGFYRGAHCYSYGYEAPKERLPNQAYMYLYSRAAERAFIQGLAGFMGTVVYLHPLLLFLVVPKELYRLEVNMRGLEDEKKSDFYNRLLM